ncbi:hypothetical protein SAICODRAFT_51959 [Saitoella complicata NRRL Y-17804]|uniref:uncharacterized protein n=1 Tax=Saitoella complicata (strain BCRC 22490 / CBS 7301 / JCM 7358 / NBRC 10748 / NRRL Y-17804) TaxID=698492 RepID=UPI0008679303|nr:uncharacterized protein SAICODRAFT_51959 [Saitoella complicata NRRL Y-17804]ODQ55880.1 hypothetical protein SAICODRAFT_51959 [Saitoella complicata NRRL Y-17804]
MTHRLATPEFLNTVKKAWPKTSTAPNPWYLIAAIPFTYLNLPHEVPHIVHHALSEDPADGHAARLSIARRTRDALFKSGINGGMPKAINALAALHDSLPPELIDKEPLRNITTSTPQIAVHGESFFRQTYASAAPITRSRLWSIYPDLGYYATRYTYGQIYGFTEILNAAETSFVQMAALVSTEVWPQARGHYRTSLNNGASVGEVESVREMVVRCCERVKGEGWGERVPEIDFDQDKNSKA